MSGSACASGKKGDACGFSPPQDGPLGGVSFRGSEFQVLVSAGVLALSAHVGKVDGATLLSSSCSKLADAPLTGGGGQDEESDWEPTPGEAGVQGRG